MLAATQMLRPLVFFVVAVTVLAVMLIMLIVYSRKARKAEEEKRRELQSDLHLSDYGFNVPSYDGDMSVVKYLPDDRYLELGFSERFQRRRLRSELLIIPAFLLIVLPWAWEGPYGGTGPRATLVLGLQGLMLLVWVMIVWLSSVSQTANQRITFDGRSGHVRICRGNKWKVNPFVDILAVSMEASVPGDRGFGWKISLVPRSGRALQVSQSSTADEREKAFQNAAPLAQAISKILGVPIQLSGLHQEV